MGIFRVKKDNNYSVINNTGLKDKRLSWKAKGILAYILTLPDDWVFYREELSQHAKDGINSLRAGMQELKEYGYIKRFPIKDVKTKLLGGRLLFTKSHWRIFHQWKIHLLIILLLGT